MNYDENDEPEWERLREGTVGHPIEVRETDDLRDLYALKEELQSALEHVDEELRYRKRGNTPSYSIATDETRERIYGESQ